MFVACTMTPMGLIALWLDVFALFLCISMAGSIGLISFICLSLWLGVPDFICWVSLAALYIFHSDTCICLLDLRLFVCQCPSDELLAIHVTSDNQ